MGHELGKKQILNTDYIPLQSFLELNPFEVENLLNDI
jgi:hypothetical protein